MSRWTAQDKEAHRTEIMQRLNAAMPSGNAGIRLD
jgi:hypothetical protein